MLPTNVLLENHELQGIVHCDIKPANVVMGVGEHANDICIIDFGVSYPYLDPITGNILLEKTGLVGDKVGGVPRVSLHCGCLAVPREVVETT